MSQISEKNGMGAVIARSMSSFRTGAVGFMSKKVLKMPEKGCCEYHLYIRQPRLKKDTYACKIITVKEIVLYDR